MNFKITKLIGFSIWFRETNLLASNEKLLSVVMKANSNNQATELIAKGLGSSVAQVRSSGFAIN